MRKNKVIKEKPELNASIKEGILERKNIDEIRYYEKMNDS